MLRYISSSYTWSLPVDLAMKMSEIMGEIEDMCAPRQEAANQGKAVRETSANKANKLCSLAEEDEANDRLFPTGERYNLAATYYLTCERLQIHDAPDRLKRYKMALEP